MERMTANVRIDELQAPASTGLARMVGSWIAWFRREREVRQAVDTLMTLDDRMLADIGLDRSHAEYVVRNGRLPSWAEQSR
jgi:uncharacterized protein YjiS (DUF1127 family)